MSAELSVGLAALGAGAAGVVRRGVCTERAEAAQAAVGAGISPATVEQSAAYIDGWRKKLGSDPKLVVHAAGAGQRAADWILAQHHTK